VSAAQRQLELTLQQARYQAGHARQQYDAVDPANRLVAGELERRWNEVLLAVQCIEGEIAAVGARKPPPLGERERQQLMQLGADFELAWSHPAATAATRKRILRTALNEIVVRREAPSTTWCSTGRAEIILRCRLTEAECGGQAPLADPRGYDVAGSRFSAPDARSADRTTPQSRWQADQPRQRLDRSSGRSFRNYSEIAVYCKGEWAERGEITLEAAAEIIDVAKMTLLRMIQRGDIKGRQPCKERPGSSRLMIWPSSVPTDQREGR
jgi:hypothetical protein